jgi:hypothetical protein
MVLAELWRLWQQQHAEGAGLFVPNTHFADRLSLSPRTVGEVLHQLAAAGYVRRSVHPSDRRHRLLLPLPIATAGPATPPAPAAPCAGVLTAQRGGGYPAPAPLPTTEPAA